MTEPDTIPRMLTKSTKLRAAGNVGKECIVSRRSRRVDSSLQRGTLAKERSLRRDENESKDRQKEAMLRLSYFIQGFDSINFVYWCGSV